MKISAVYASTSETRQAALEVAENAQVGDVIPALQQALRLDNADMAHGVGVWGQRVGMTHRLQAGDRVEVYRPLTIDPMTARRLRASANQRGG